MQKRKIYIFAILLLPILMLYIKWFNFGFIEIDDGSQVLENTKLHQLSISNLKEIFSSATIGMYQLLTSLSFAFVIALFGLKTAFPFHVLSFLLHCLNTYLVFIFGKNILKEKVNPYILPLFFALHPLAVEAVAWVSATSTLLFTSFFLLATLQYIKYSETNHKKNYRLSILFFVLGALSKIQILPFVAVLFLIDYLKGKPIFNKKSLIEKIPFLIIAVLFAIITLYFRGGSIGVSHDNFNPIYLIPTQFVWYIYKTFLPLNLGIVYDWPTEILTLKYILSGIFFIGLIFFTYKKRANKLFVFGVGFFLFNIVLHTSFFSSFLGPYADRYAYLSSIGIWIAIISLVQKKQQFTFNLIHFYWTPLSAHKISSRTLGKYHQIMV